MANPKWGAKHICHSCGTRYYDLQRSPIVCPKCNSQYDPEAFLKSRRTRTAAVEELPAAKPAAKKKAAVAAKEPKEAAEVELEADADTAALDELEKADDTVDVDVDVDDDDDDDDDDVLLEDASDLEDDDVVKVVDIGKEDDPNA